MVLASQPALKSEPRAPWKSKPPRAMSAIALGPHREAASEYLEDVSHLPSVTNEDQGGFSLETGTDGQLGAL